MSRVGPSKKLDPIYDRGELVVIPGPHRAAQPKTSALSILWKSQPCICGEYVGLMFLVTGIARVSGVAHVLVIDEPVEFEK